MDPSSTIVLLAGTPRAAANVSGAGNANAVALSQKSPIVQSAFRFLLERPRAHDQTCEPTPDAINEDLREASRWRQRTRRLRPSSNCGAGLVVQTTCDLPGGLLAGVFPPLVNDGSACPQLPQAFYSAPGSVSGGHHSYPGGLPVHESNNDIGCRSRASIPRRVWAPRGGFALVDTTFRPARHLPGATFSSIRM